MDIVNFEAEKTKKEIDSYVKNHKTAINQSCGQIQIDLDLIKQQHQSGFLKLSELEQVLIDPLKHSTDSILQLWQKYYDMLKLHILNTTDNDGEADLCQLDVGFLE